ncbi:PKD domain-containing protein [Streptomyces sp. NPDC058289]|uniref:PKD domain-containing protein n=1 Tax=Streptomyces sp. NPDC058289 TaxID=3346425 RepID=UPI0036E18976
MRPSRAMVLLTAGLVTFIGMPAATAAELPTDLYVENGLACTDSGSGTPTSPFCTFAAAAKAAKPGQTVHVNARFLEQPALTVDRSGAPGKPITFAFTPENEFHDPGIQTLAISGASHVVVQGLRARTGVSISSSHDVVLEEVEVRSTEVVGGASLGVGEGSTDVRVSRSSLDRAVIAGAQRTVLSRNALAGTGPLSVVDAPGTVITNNDINNFTDADEGVESCDKTVEVRGASSGSSVFNNLLMAAGNTTCTTPQLSVAQSATSGTRADYNVIVGAKDYPTVAYQWAGTTYPTAAAFLAASGQGARDVLLPTVAGLAEADSPLIDSADATAPGVLPVDKNGHPTTDDPRVPNTGKDGAYLDRGATETNDGFHYVRLKIDHPWAPAGTKVTFNPGSDSTWPTTMTYTVDFGDGTAPAVVRPGDAADVTHVYGSPCACVVKTTATNGIGKKISKEETVRATAPGELATAFTATPVLPAPDHDPNRVVRPLTLRVDTTTTVAPWGVSRVDVDFGDGTHLSRPGLQTATYSYKQPGTYEVKVTVYDVKGAQSTASRTAQVGYAASGYVATTPFRLLDTRYSGNPVLHGAPRSVELLRGATVPRQFPAGGMAAVVLNVTVTGATQDTHLSIWPSGQARPETSNVNVRTGGTSSNTVTVPVGADGKIQAQLNSGSASLIVDFVGYYQPNAGDRFSPLAPTRVLDTRTTGGALPGAKTRTVKVAGVNGIPADAKAVALNLTGTGATQPAHVIAYPDPAKRPATSNLNVQPGKDKSNQAIVPVGPDGTITLFTNSGSTHLILDAVGYYGKDGKALFTPVIPKRLADTRTTGKVAPGATTTVSGLPANALGAVLNITATDTTAPGFLTAYGYGGKLPGASSLNTLPGLTVPNHVTTPVGTGGKVNIFNSYGGPNHVITDLLGYFTTG